MINLSIIIPVYNVARYIERCLRFVEAQTLHDIEVIFVDDHGQDDTDQQRAEAVGSCLVDIIAQGITCHCLKPVAHEFDAEHEQAESAEDRSPVDR